MIIDLSQPVTWGGLLSLWAGWYALRFVMLIVVHLLKHPS